MVRIVGDLRAAFEAELTMSAILKGISAGVRRVVYDTYT